MDIESIPAPTWLMPRLVSYESDDDGGCYIGLEEYLAASLDDETRDYIFTTIINGGTPSKTIIRAALTKAGITPEYLWSILNKLVDSNAYIEAELWPTIIRKLSTGKRKTGWFDAWKSTTEA